MIADLLGVFSFAISGSLLAARRGYDLIGSIMLGSLVGLGGGTIRDLILGLQPLSFSNPFYLIPPILAAVVVHFAFPYVDRVTRTLLLFDAFGLALFCITGTTRALDAGFNPIGSTLLGITTAVGGGVMRDVVANQNPVLFSRHDIYAIPAILGAALTTGVWYLGWLNVASGLAIAVVVFGFRVLSWRFNWYAPRSARRPPEGVG